MELTTIRLGRTKQGTTAFWRDPYTHCFICGKSGSGKTNLIVNMIKQDSYWPTATVVIDPSGFMAKDAWAICRGKHHYCSIDHPVSINPMELPYSPDVVSDHIAEAVNQVIARTTANEMMTSKMRQILDTSIKWNLERNRKSLIHVRDHLASLTGDNQTREGILARLDFLLNNEAMKRILCGNRSIKWGELIRKGETFVLDCYGMSEEKMVFVGSLITHQIKAYFRHERPKRYNPLRVYIDEAHNFITKNILGILKEARKFKFSFVMATVDFAGIHSDLVHSLCNVGTLIAFRCGFREAQLFSREFNAYSDDLQFLPKYWFGYLTPRERGYAKAPSPPYIKKFETPKAELRSVPKWKGWYVSESYQPVT